MDLLRIAARVASSQSRVSSDGGDEMVIMHLHVDDKHEHYKPLAEDDGTIAMAFQEVVGSLGGEVSDWEKNGLWVNIPKADTEKWKSHLEAMKTGEHGAEARMVAEAYSLEEFTDEDGNPIQSHVSSDGGEAMVTIKLDESSGEYAFETEETSRTDSEVVFKVTGTDSEGQPFQGNLKVHLENDEFDGWDWESVKGAITEDPDVIQPVLDFLEDSQQI